MRLAFILDPLESLKAYKDSSVAMMREAQRRGHEVHAIMRAALTWRDGAVCAAATRLEFDPQHAEHGPWCVLQECEHQPLRAFDAVLMRQDPPFDFEYVTATWLLERAEAEGARIFNRPRAIRDDTGGAGRRRPQHLHQRSRRCNSEAARRHGRQLDFPGAA